MKSTKNILLFLALIIGQYSYAIDPYTSTIYKNSFVSTLDNNDDFNSPKLTPEYSNKINANQPVTSYGDAIRPFEVTVDSVTEESYITPEMQWAIESLIFAIQDIGIPKELAIDSKTGVPVNALPVRDILETISELMSKPAYQTCVKEGLHAMLEATEIALELVKLKMAYKEEAYVGRQDLIVGLNQQKDAIQTNINLLNKINPNNSYYSWIFGSGSTGKSSQSTINNLKPIPFDHKSEYILIPADRMATIIKHNDYKQKSNATDAANLLFQQCFIAQQQFRSPESIIPINPKNPFVATDYIYATFPKIYNKAYNNYPICNDILKLQDKNARRSRLLQIRQAVQTSLFIANKKSGYNAGNLFPQSVVSYLDGIVAELMRYDAYLNVLCKNPLYGMRPEDMAKADEWSTISKVAAGIIVVAGTAAAAHYAMKNNDPKALQQFYDQASNAMGWFTGSSKTGSDVGSSVSSAMGWFTGSSTPTAATQPATAIGPKPLENAPAAPVDNKDESISQKIKNMFSSNTPAPAAPVKKYNSEIIAEEEAQAAQAAKTAVAPKKVTPTKYWNNDDASDFDDYMQQQQADAIQYEKDIETVKGSGQFTALGGQAAAKAAGISYQQIAQRADTDAKSKEIIRKQMETDSKGATTLLKEREKALNKEQTAELKLQRDLALAKSQLELAQAKNPNTGLFGFGADAPAVADARAKVAKLAEEKDTAYKTVQSQKELVSDAQKLADEKAAAILKARNEELQAKKVQEEAVRLGKVANIIEKENKEQKTKDQEAKLKKLEEELNQKEAALNQSGGFGEWLQSAQDNVVNKAEAIKDSIVNYQLPTMDDISNKATSIKNNVVNYQLPRASADKAPYQLTGLEKMASMKDSVSNAINSAMTPSTPTTYATQQYSSQNIRTAPGIATPAPARKKYYSEMTDEEQ